MAATPTVVRCPRASICCGWIPHSGAPSRASFGSADPPRRETAARKSAAPPPRAAGAESRFSCGSPVLDFFASLPRDRLRSRLLATTTRSLGHRDDAMGHPAGRQGSPVKQQAIDFRELLERLLPLHELPLADRVSVQRALRSGVSRQVEEAGMFALRELERAGAVRRLP